MSANKISEHLEKALKLIEKKRKEARGFEVVIRTKPETTGAVVNTLKRMDIKVLGTVENFVFADVKNAGQLDRIAKLRNVEYVSKSKRFYPMVYGLDELVKRISLKLDPIYGKLSTQDLQSLGYTFKPASEIPSPFSLPLKDAKIFADILRNPVNITKYVKPLAPLPIIARADWKLVTDTRKIMGVPKENQIKNTKVGNIDSELYPHPAWHKPYENILLNDPSPMGHGMWTSSCAFGNSCPTRFGNFVPVADAKAGMTFVKVFSGVPLGCSSMQIMKAMKICAEKRAKVVNMSLGGSLSDDIENDSECVLLDKLTKKHNMIFCVAAGNEDKKGWEIGSPGAALDALTVAAYDWKSMDVSSYSSRGPQGKYYKDHQDKFEEHLAKYGDRFLKPDVGGMGGDRKTQIVAGTTSWYDGIYDFIPDKFDMMIGTSMATPHLSGITALALDRGLIKKVEDMKRIAVANGQKKNKEGGYGLFKWSWLKK